MTERTYRAGIIGLGFIGAGDQVSGDVLGQRVSDLDGTHFEALSRHPRVELVGGSSRDAGRRERFEQRAQVPAYADWRQMVERERLDILSVATYAPVHAEIVVHCAKHVRAIYCEKPIATRLADAQQMTDACDAAGTLLAINHNRRYNPNYRRLRDLISAGGLGDLTSVNVQWGSGRLGNVGTHLFDAVRMLTGREVQAVSGTLDLSGRPDCRGPQFRDPGGWGLLKLDGGLIATVDAADYGRTPVSITLNGTKGRATTGGGDVRIEFWNGEQEHWQNLRDEATSMDRAVAEIVACLDGAAPFSNPATEAVRTLEVIVGFHASHRRNACWTELPLSDDGRAIEVNSG